MRVKSHPTKFQPRRSAWKVLATAPQQRETSVAKGAVLGCWDVRRGGVNLPSEQRVNLPSHQSSRAIPTCS